MYLAVVLDLFSRRIVGWSTGSRLTEDLVSRALAMALTHRGTSPALHHSDRGSQYTASAYRELLDQNGVTVSMSRRGDCWDNAPVESFFASLKSERLDHEVLWSRRLAQRVLFEYIELFYNRRRLHSSLDYQSPQDFERRSEEVLKTCGKEAEILWETASPQTPLGEPGATATGLI